MGPGPTWRQPSIRRRLRSPGSPRRLRENSRLGAPEFHPPAARCVAAAVSASSLYAEAHRRTPLFRNVLFRIAEFLDSSGLRQAWGAGAEDPMDVDSAPDMHRSWSAVQFAFLVARGSGVDADPRSEYGDGVPWAGCTLVHLLGQRNRFELLDFSYHIDHVHVFDGASTAAGEASKVKIESEQAALATAFVHRVRKVRAVNSSVFSLLGKTVPEPPHDLIIFHPPPLDGVDAESRSVPGGGVAAAPTTTNADAGRLFIRGVWLNGQPSRRNSLSGWPTASAETTAPSGAGH